MLLLLFQADRERNMDDADVFVPVLSSGKAVLLGGSCFIVAAAQTNNSIFKYLTTSYELFKCTIFDLGSSHFVPFKTPFI